MKTLKQGLDRLLATVCIIDFIGIVLLTVYQVTMRYVFKSPNSVSRVLARYCFVWLILLSATCVLGQRDHICIALLEDKLMGSTRETLDIINEIVIIVFSGIILVYGGMVTTAMNMPQYNSILKIPAGTVHSITPVCGVLIIFYSLYNLREIFTKKEGGVQTMFIAVQVAIVMVISLVVMLAAGIPIGVGIGLSSTVSTICMPPGNVAFTTSVQRIFADPSSFSLIAIPFLTLAGNIMNNGGIALCLVNCARALGGKMSGFLAQANVIANMPFGAISGSSAAAAAAIGSTVGPLEEEEGCGKNYPVAVNVASVPVGMLIPPSNTMIVYPMVAGSVSIAALLMAGYIPGIIWGAGVIILATTAAKRLGYRSSSELTLKIALKAFWQTVPDLLMIVIVIGGILGGIFTATKGPAVAVVYATVLSFIYGSIKVKDTPRIVLDPVKITGTITFMIGLSSIMSWAMAFTGVPGMIATAVLSVTSNKFLILLLISAILLFVDTFMDPAPTILIFTPIPLLICTSLGMSAVQFGIVLCYNFPIGTITPPVGTILFTGYKVGGVTTESVISHLLPYFGIIIVGLLLVTYIPVLSLGLPSLLGSI